MHAKFPDELTIPFQLDQASLLGRGATADVYFVIVGDKRFAAKIYKSDTEFNVEKIALMCKSENPSYLPFTTFAWPIGLIFEKENVIGYLMPIFEKLDHHPLNYYFDSSFASKLSNKSIVSLSNRIEIAKSLSFAIDSLHKISTFFIDLKPQNILVNWRTNGIVILDCDGFSIQMSNGKLFPAGHVSTDYIAPEVTREHLPPSSLAAPQDNYALAVILFQLFNYSQHPFQGTPVTESTSPFTTDELAAEGLYPYSLTPNPKIYPRRGSTHTCLPTDLRVLFDRSFSDQQDIRVTPQEWTSYFSNIIYEKKIQRCSSFPHSVDHIHFSGYECPECARIKFRVQLETNKPKTPLPKPDNTADANKNVGMPAAITTQQNGDSTWKWLLALSALVFFIYLANKDDSSRVPTTTTNKPVVTTPNNKPVVTTPNIINSPRQVPADWSQVFPGNRVSDITGSEFKYDSTGRATILNVFISSQNTVNNLKNPALFIRYDSCAPTKTEMANAQKALATQGFRIGIVDGIRGPVTINALKSFQQNMGIPISGDLDIATANKLNLYVGAFDPTQFNFHGRGLVYKTAGGPMVSFSGVKSTKICFYVSSN